MAKVYVTGNVRISFDDGETWHDAGELMAPPEPVEAPIEAPAGITCTVYLVPATVDDEIQLLDLHYYLTGDFGNN